MKQFLKYTLATIVGIMIVSLISSFMFFMIIGALLSSSESVTSLKPNSVYQLDVRGTLVERSKDDPFAMLLSGRYTDTSIGLDDILSNINKAKNNPNIVGIRLNCGALSGGYASVKEIRDALADFKESGKFIIAYADNYTQKMYYLASVADEVYLNPVGALSFNGIASSAVFYKDMFDKLGIEMQVVKVGEFKSAVEPYINTQMSEANKKQVNVYVSSIWNNLLKEVSASRDIPVLLLNGYADEAMDFSAPEKAVEYGMIDDLLYSTDIDELINSKLYDAKDKVTYVKHSSMITVPDDRKYNKQKLAVIYAVGGIDMDEADGINSARLVKTINKVAKDSSIEAVVFRVNSPGGSAYGSEQIWHALSKLQESKHLVVSMGDYAASGGYYISCLADKIYAQPNTLTGSIGVYGLIPNVEKLTDKIGLDFDVVKTNKMSDALSINRPFTSEEYDLMQQYVNRTYEIFVKRCADGREMTTEQIKAIAEGRVWTGENALEIGLVDELGSLSDAIDAAAEAAGLLAYSVVQYPEKEDFTTRLLNNMSEEVEVRFLKANLGEQYQLFKEVSNIGKQNGIHARMPYVLELR